MKKIYYSNSEYELKNILKEMDVNEQVYCIHGIRHSSKDNLKGHYKSAFAMSIIKENPNGYVFCSDFMFDGHDMVNQVCKDLNIKKWPRILGIRILFTYDELLIVFKHLKKYFNDNHYIGEDKVFKYLTFEETWNKNKLEQMRIPYEIYLLEKEIDFFTKFHESIDDKKKRLKDLKDLEFIYYESNI